MVGVVAGYEGVQGGDKDTETVAEVVPAEDEDEQVPSEGGYSGQAGDDFILMIDTY